MNDQYYRKNEAWEANELTQLKDLRAKGMQINEIAKILFRTPQSITYKLNFLQIYSPDKWTSDEVTLLKEMAGKGIKHSEIAKTLNKTIGAIAAKLNKLKIRLFNPKIWTQLEIDELKKLKDDNFSIEEIAKKMGKTKNSIQYMCAKFRFINKDQWDNNELIRLRELYSKKVPYNEIAKILNKPKRAIAGRIAYEHSRDCNTVNWSENQILLIKELISQNKTIREITNNLNLPYEKVASKIKQLGLKKPKNWSKEEIETAIDLAKKGHTLTEISKIILRPRRAISKKLINFGIRKRKGISLFTLEEQEKILKLLNNGKTLKEIGVILNRSLDHLMDLSRRNNLCKFARQTKQNERLEKHNLRKCMACLDIFPNTIQFFNNENDEIRCSQCVANKNTIKYITRIKYGDLERLFTERMSQIKTAEKARGINHTISIEFLISLYYKQNGLCYYTGEKMSLESCSSKVVSVDRIDSNKGYIEDNIVLCCFYVNIMKRDWTINEFINNCEKVVQHMKLKRI